MGNPTRGQSHTEIVLYELANLLSHMIKKNNTFLTDNRDLKEIFESMEIWHEEMLVMVDKGQESTGKSVIKDEKLAYLGTTCKDSILHVPYLNQQYTRKAECYLWKVTGRKIMIKHD